MLGNNKKTYFCYFPSADGQKTKIVDFRCKNFLFVELLDLKFSYKMSNIDFWNVIDPYLES